MQIDDFPGKRFEKTRFDHPHEAREHDDIRRAIMNGLDVARLPFPFELGLKWCRIKIRRWHTKLRAELQDTRIRLVGEEVDNLTTTETPGALCLQDRLGVTAATRT